LSQGHKGTRAQGLKGAGAQGRKGVVEQRLKGWANESPPWRGKASEVELRDGLGLWQKTKGRLYHSPF